MGSSVTKKKKQFHFDLISEYSWQYFFLVAVEEEKKGTTVREHYLLL